MNRTKVKILCIANAIVLGLGLGGPCMTVRPEFGNFTGLVKFLQPSFTETVTYSVLDGCSTLVADGKYVVAFVVIGFSVVFPLVKLTVLWSALWAATLGKADSSRSDRHTLIDKLGKYSMIDVFVMALLVLAVKGLPGGSAIDLHWGLGAFGAAALMTMWLAQLTRKLREPDSTV